MSRPIFPMGNDLGYLPGEIEEKLNPWMQPIFDNLEFLLERQKGRKVNSVAKLLTAQPPEAVAAIRSRARELLSEYESDDGLEVPGSTLVASTRRG